MVRPKSPKHSRNAMVAPQAFPLGILPTPLKWEPGNIIEGKYVVEGVINDTYKVRHLLWQVPLMVKTHPLLAPDEVNKKPDQLATIIEQRYQSFTQQADQWIQLGTHPNLVSAYYVRIIGGAPRLFLEYVNGGHLLTWMESGELDDLEFILDLAIQICRGMAYIEKTRGAHGNLKPNHILLTTEGKVKTTHPSFEARKEAKASSWPYCAPEHLESQTTPDLKGDIFSFGVILYEMCCRRLPYPTPKDNRDPVKTYRKIYRKYSPTNPREFNNDIPIRLAELMLSFLAKNPAHRPASFYEIGRRLSGLYDEITGTAYDRRESNETSLRAISLNNMALAKLDLAYGKARAEKQKEALDLLEQAVQVDPFCVGAVINYNLLRLRTGLLPYKQFRMNTMALLAKQEKSLIHYHAGASLEKGTLLAETLHEVDDALEHYPDDHQLLRLHAQLLYRVRQFEEATATLERLRSTGQATNDDIYLLGACYLEAGNIKEAGHIWLEGLAASPDHLYLLLGCALISIIRGKWEKSEEFLHKIIREHSSFSCGLLYFAEYLGACGMYVPAFGRLTCKPKMARKLYDNLLKRLPCCPRAVQGYQYLAEQQGWPPFQPDVVRSSGVVEFPQWTAIKKLEGAPGTITCLCHTPDGRHVVSGALIEKEAPYGTLQIWEIPGGRCIHSIEEHTFRVTCVTITSDGRYAISGSRDRTLRIWALETGLAIQALTGHQSWINCVTISPNDQYIVSGSRDRTLKVWNREDGKLLHTLQGHGGGVSAVVITPDNKKIVSAGGDHNIVVWKIETGRMLHYLEGHRGPIYSLVLSPDGATAFSGSGDATIRAWDIAQGQEIQTFEGHQGAVYCLAITRDGRQIISASADKTLRIWDVSSGQCLHVLEGHTDEVRALTLSAEQCHIFSGGKDGAIRIWDRASGELLTYLEGHTAMVSCITTTNDGRYMISGGEDHTLRIWEDITTRLCPPIPVAPPEYLFEKYQSQGRDVRLRRKFEQQLEQGRKAAQAEKYAEAMRLYRQVQQIPGYEHDPRILSNIYETGVNLGFKRNGFREIWLRRKLSGHSDSIECLRILGNGLLASGGRDNNIRIWEMETGRCLHTLSGHTSWLKCITVTPNGEYLISGSRGQSLRVWNLKTGKPLHPLEGHSKWSNALQTTPDSRTVVSAGSDHTLQVWDIETGTLLHALAGHTLPVRCVQVTSNGQLAISGGEDGVVIIWDLENGSIQQVLEEHRHAVACLQITNDNRYIVSGGYDGKVCIWDLTAGKLCHAVQAHSDWIRDLVLTPDDLMIISCGDDENVISIDLSSGKILARLQGHQDSVYQVAVTAEGRYAVSGGLDGAIWIWDLPGKQAVHTINEVGPAVYGLVLSPAGRYLILNIGEKDIPMWEIDWQWEGEG